MLRSSYDILGPLSCGPCFIMNFTGEEKVMLGALGAILAGIFILVKESPELFSSRAVKNKPAYKHVPTPILDRFAIDFTEKARRGGFDPIIGRDKEVEKTIQILSRRGKNNVLLVGDPGVGKTAIAEGLAQRIVLGDVPDHLDNKRVLSLEISNLLSGTKYRGEFEERAQAIVREIIASNRTIILFIDEIHSLIQSKGTEGSVNFTDILKPALARGDMQMIGATTFAEYEQYIRTDSSLERRFQPVEILEPSDDQALAILRGVKDKYRDYHKVEFTDEALKAAVAITKKLVKERKLPDKAIDAMDEAGAMVRVNAVNSLVPTLLTEAAKNSHPEVRTLWQEIEILDKKISTRPTKTAIAKRERLEKELGQRGVRIVDADDVRKVITDWGVHTKF